ncbi:MAG: hypothetical protein IKS20_12835, partial [Victivallales bacterium]|nr:hypothetical protein [Victivallales bacterium]
MLCSPLGYVLETSYSPVVRLATARSSDGVLAVAPMARCRYKYPMPDVRFQQRDAGLLARRRGRRRYYGL